MAIYKKIYATSRDRMPFKTKYPNCRHNFGRTRPVTSFQDLGDQNTFYGEIFLFLSHVNKFFWAQQNLWGHKKIWG